MAKLLFVDDLDGRNWMKPPIRRAGTQSRHHTARHTKKPQLPSEVVESARRWFREQIANDKYRDLMDATPLENTTRNHRIGMVRPPKNSS
jgi:hypothetical protein